MDTATLTVVVGVLAFASFVQAVSGFGMALIALAALPLVIDVRAVIGLVTVFNVFASVATLAVNWSGFSFRHVRSILLGMLVGLPVGFYFLHGTETRVLVRVLGGVLIGLALLEILFARRGYFALPRWTAFPCGLVGGTIGGAFTAGGPPVVAYVYSQDWNKAEIVAGLQVTFIVGGLFRSGLMAAAGDHTREIWMMTLWSLPAGLLAIWAGKRVLGRIRLRWLRVGVFGFLLVMGVKYLVSP